MAKKEDCVSVMDMEEGELSDSASIEEISAEDFVKPEPQPRVWTMRDLYKYQNKYQSSSNYASGLYNLAWAQAVQNKPLDEVIVMDFKQSGSSNSTSNENVVIDVSGDEEVGDCEKEEGELEEGEIDLDSGSGCEAILENNELSEKESDLEKKVGLIRQGLENLTVNDVENSYGEVYARLQSSLDSLSELTSGNYVPNKDVLINLAFSAIQNIHSAFGSMDENDKEENRGMISRLLAHVINQKPTVFSPEQLKEIEVMIPSLDKEKKVQVVTEWVDRNHTDTSVETTNQNNPKMLLESLKSGLAKARGSLLPLLDLHIDHDADSLPSPTREAPPVLFRGALETGNPIMQHPYGTEAHKAVSFYQQKFGRSSVMNDMLPSPTPSEDGDNGDNDNSGEVSSSSVVSNVKSEIGSILPPIVSSKPMDVSRNTAPVSSGSNSMLRTSARSRDPRLRFANTDNEPKTEPFGGRKQKIVEEDSVFDGPTLKRQRNELTDNGIVRDVQPVSSTGGWLEDRGTVGLQGTSRNHVIENKGGDARKLENTVTSSANRILVVENKASDPRKLENVVTSSGTTSAINEAPLVTNSNPTVSLQSLLQGIVVNPTIWMNITKMQQTNPIDPPKITSQQPPSLNSILEAVMNVAPINPSVPGEKSAGIIQTPQASSKDESSAKIRMKPRDPRRVLHSKSSLKSESSGSDQSLTNTSSGQGDDNLNPIKQDDIKMPVVSQSTTPPDITRQFTSSLKNIADIMSVSQSSQTQPTVAQTPSSQPPSSQAGQVHPSWVGRKDVFSESGLIQSGSNSVSEEGPANRSKPKNTWGEVEHLFEGFDDKQKAAIQRERTRRIEEQNKMFASRKLCLVLDLDHTLLNSAKFLEVDPAHDELLRKKEEQDREKPQRHLFRFPHMAMWTKLRPGIWKFLEKASKLYEMHLYTMGNKLYATEMAKVLDPKGVLFSGRVISKGDDGDLVDGKSKDLEGVLGMESAVVILDDSIRVWPHNKLNLIVVERYIYFPCSRRQFGLPGPSLLEIDHDERAEDGTLASSLAVIEKIHNDFFMHKSLDEADVRNILASEQQKILGGCRILFSRVFPVGEAKPHLHPLWQTAEQFGAVCTNQIDEQVTHVVANSLGTDKVNWALSTGRFVVHPTWVEASALLYRKANEKDFAIKS